MPKISVIIPTYNCASVVSNALDSVFAQTMQDFDLILVDDGSTDNTLEALGPYLNKPNCKYIFQRNSGPAAARNLGAKESTAEYLIFLDADDALAPNSLELISKAFDESRASLCLMDMERVIGEKHTIQHTVLPQGDPFYALIKNGDFIRRAPAYRRTVFLEAGMYDETLWFWEDWDMHIRLLEKRQPFVYVNSPLYIYILRQGSLTKGGRSQVPRALNTTERIYKKHLKRLADAGDKLAAGIYSENMWALGVRYLRNTKDYKRSISCFFESQRYDFHIRRLLNPFSFRANRLLKRLKNETA